nr:uncharacterized protein LOC116150639 [Camelus dromedarius]
MGPYFDGSSDALLRAVCTVPHPEPPFASTTPFSTDSDDCGQERPYHPLRGAGQGSECGPQASSVYTSCECIRNADSGPHPGHQDQIRHSGVGAPGLRALENQRLTGAHLPSHLLAYGVSKPIKAKNPAPRGCSPFRWTLAARDGAGLSATDEATRLSHLPGSQSEASVTDAPPGTTPRAPLPLGFPPLGAAETPSRFTVGGREDKTTRWHGHKQGTPSDGEKGVENRSEAVVPQESGPRAEPRWVRTRLLLLPAVSSHGHFPEPAVGAGAQGAGAVTGACLGEAALAPAAGWEPLRGCPLPPPRSPLVGVSFPLGFLSHTPYLGSERRKRFCKLEGKLGASIAEIRVSTPRRALGLLCCKLSTDIERGSLCCTEPEKEARRPCLGSVCPAPRGTEASPARKLDGTGGWRQTDSTQTLISARVRATGLASVPSRASVRPVGLPVSVSPNPEPVHWNFPIRRARGNRRSTQSESKFPGGGPSGSPAVDADASWVPSKIVAGAAKGVCSEPSHPHRQQE